MCPCVLPGGELKVAVVSRRFYKKKLSPDPAMHLSGESFLELKTISV
jgi:hypothetical protein